MPEPHDPLLRPHAGHGVLALPPAVRITEFQGREQVLAQQLLLAALAERWGQKGVVDHLEFYLQVPYFGSKLPHLLLFYEEYGSELPSASGLLPAAGPGPLTEARGPVAAVLLHQYRLLGVRTGLFIPADATGDWTVIAWPGARTWIAGEAAKFLLERKAWVVLLSVAAGEPVPTGVPGNKPPAPAPGGERPRAAAARTQLRTLSLGPTLEATLATMGAHTRRNLRLARRRAETQLAASFHADAAFSEEEFLRLNRNGFYPVPERVARWRFRSAHSSPGGFFSGVQAGDGRWLAVTGGRRFESEAGSCTVIDWQVNHTAFAPFSPGSVMRALLIEHEVALSTAELRFEGGTPHSMRSAFREERVTDLLFSGLAPGILRRLARSLPKGNLLGDTMKHSDLTWYERPSLSRGRAGKVNAPPRT